jgi:hypothetical protein
MPVFAAINTEQLAGLLRAALVRLSTSSHPAIHYLTQLPAFQQLTTAQVKNVILAAIAAVPVKRSATPALPAGEGDVEWHMPHVTSAASNVASLQNLCSSILRKDTVAGRGTAAVMQRLLPAVTAALSAGLPEYARLMVFDAAGVLGTDEVLVLMQAALQAAHTGVLLSQLFRVPAADSLHAKDVLQLLRSIPAGSSTLCTFAQGAIVYSKACISASAEYKFAIAKMACGMTFKISFGSV